VGVFCLRPPELPQWDVDVAIPVFQGGFRLLNWLDPEHFEIAPDSSISFRLVLPIDTVRPDGAVDLLSVNEVNDFQVADFLFRGFGGGRVNIELGELLGIPIPDTGMKLCVAPFEKTTVRDCQLPDIQSAEIVEGVANVTVGNYTKLAFDSVVVWSPVNMVRLGRLEPGESESRRIAVGGVVVVSPLALRIGVGSAGTGVDTVQLAKADSLVVTLVLDSLHITSGRVRVLGAEGGRRYPVKLVSARPMRIDSLTLSQGRCDFVLANRFAIPIQIHFGVPGLGIESDCPIEPYHATTLGADLKQLTITNRGRMNSLFDFFVTAKAGPCSSFVELSKDDGLGVAYTTAELKAQAVTGEFRQPVYVASRLETLPRIPFGVRGLRMSHVELALDMDNTVGFPIEIEVRLTACRDARAVGRLERVLILEPGQLGAPSHSSNIVDITDLINTGPDFITFEYVASVMDQGSFGAGACVTGQALVSTPLRLALAADTVELPARLVSLSETQRQQLAGHLVSGAAQVTATSRVGVGLRGQLVVVPDATANRDSATVVDSIVLPFAVPAGRLDRRGFCVATQDTALTFELDSSQVSLFRTHPLNVRVSFELPNSDTVIVWASDTVSVSALVRLRVRVKE